ncbi:hypothetical protein Rxycam_00022 [Rubrobacter xylanophilus DSM 9941]|uniref:hypothetical protein n=1 Tax=Rubrobacter xylanophilus TaxID=49319 RepID=UPI001C63FC64|nr:hypothetical protein [Rubrobacter xylanophilus]QYJ14226.1 hypothetical protein Rxycam_00022 [Rubrobacter xylanophilus DSM 9941]
MTEEVLPPAGSGDVDLAVARSIAEAVLALKGVYSLGAGRYAEAATYGAGEKVVGVVVDSEEARVHIVVSYPQGTPIPDLIEQVRRVAKRYAKDRRVSVVIEDVQITGDDR